MLDAVVDLVGVIVGAVSCGRWFMACFFCSGGVECAGAPVMCSLPRLNLTGSMRACSECAESCEDGFATYASGVDSCDGMFTSDTKFHTLPVDRYMDVMGGRTECVFRYESVADPLEVSSVSAFVEKVDGSAEAS